MKILSLNSNLAPWTREHSKRINLLIEKIGSIGSDVTCLQEVFIKKDAEKIINSLRELGYVDFYHTKDLLTVTKEEMPYRISEIFEEQGRLLSYSLLDTLYKKAFQSFPFIGSEDLSIIHTHLLSAAGKQEGHYKDTRKKQVLEILNNMRGYRTIMLGDFNFTYDSQAYNEIIESGFVDIFKPVPQITFPKTKTRIDYVFTRGVETLEKRVIDMKSLSDHNGLMLEIPS